MNEDGDRGWAGGVQTRVGATLGLLILAAAWAAAGPPAPAPAPTPTPAPSPAPPPPAGPPKPRLRLDLEKHVRRQVEEEAKLAPPRFTDSVEVEGRTPQSVLERQLQGVPLDCGPAGAGGGAPTETETRAVRPHSAPYADFLPLAKRLRERFKKKPADRYFLYRVRRSPGVTYELRTARVPDAWLYKSPENTYELVEAFPDLGDATRALRRLESGFARAVSTFKESLPQPWATQAPCRPR